jgi:hypothetical protein
MPILDIIITIMGIALCIFIVVMMWQLISFFSSLMGLNLSIFTWRWDSLRVTKKKDKSKEK